MHKTKRMLKRPNPAATEREIDALRTIERNAENLLDLINDVLELSKLEAGGTILDKETFALQVVLDEVIDSLSPLAATKNIEVKNLHAYDPPLLVSADRTKLSQIFTNILSNALKYTDNGSVTISVEKTSTELLVLFKDTGIGIMPNDIPRLFKRFSQLEGAQHRREGGTGLGLKITKDLVELHGGSIEVESIWQHGSVFRLRFPWSVISAQEISAGI